MPACIDNHLIGGVNYSDSFAMAAKTQGGKGVGAARSAADSSDNPNKGLGILAGCAKDSLFTEGTWNSAFCEEMKPTDGDVVIQGKKGLDSFPNTSLESELVSRGIETVVVCGFLTNCCVESTVRTACEKGFNVVALTDVCATTSEEGHNAATGGTFGMFSTPMSAADFTAKLPVADVAMAPAEAPTAPQK